MADIKVTQVGFVLGSSNKSKHLIDADNIKGGYIVVSTIAERDALPVATANDSDHDGIIVNGSLVYVTATGKSYRWDTSRSPATWVQEVSAGAGLTDVSYDGTNKKFTKTTNDGLGNANSETTSDIVSVETIKGDLGLHAIADSGSWNDLEDIPNDIVYKDDADGDYVRKGDSETNYAEDIYGVKTFKSGISVDSGADLTLNKLTASKFVKTDANKKLVSAGDTEISLTANDETIKIDGTSLKPVTKDTDQTISGEKTFTSEIKTNVIRANTGSYLQLSGVNGDITIGGQQAQFNVPLIPTSNASKDLGSSTRQWKDIYLSGTANIGNLSISSDNSGTPHFSNATTSLITFDQTVQTPILRPISDNTFDLGRYNLRWKDLYFSGDIYTGDNNGETTPTYYKLQIPTLTKDETIALTTDAHIKTASISGNTLTLTKEDNSTVVFTPDNDNNNQTIKVGNVTFGVDDAVELKGGTDISLSTTNTENEKSITITSTVVCNNMINVEITEEQLDSLTEENNYISIQITQEDYNKAIDTTKDCKVGIILRGENNSVQAMYYLDRLTQDNGTVMFSGIIDNDFLTSMQVLLNANLRGSVFIHARPSHMVSSVNNNQPDFTGNVTLTAEDVGALPDDTILPQPNNGVLTISQNGTSLGTFSADQSTNNTINIVSPKVYRYI